MVSGVLPERGCDRPHPFRRQSMDAFVHALSDSPGHQVPRSLVRQSNFVLLILDAK